MQQFFLNRILLRIGYHMTSSHTWLICQFDFLKPIFKTCLSLSLSPSRLKISI